VIGTFSCRQNTLLEHRPYLVREPVIEFGSFGRIGPRPRSRTALHHGLTVVTRNVSDYEQVRARVREFSRVKDLRIENWLR
jgi:hypothetical protein